MPLCIEGSPVVFKIIMCVLIEEANFKMYTKKTFGTVIYFK